MAGRRFPQSLGTSSGIRWRATAIVLGAIVLAVLLAWDHGGGSSRVAADSTTVPATGLDFSIGVDVDGDTIDDCDTSGAATECDIAGGSAFTLKGYLNSLPVKITEYDLVTFMLDLEGVSYAGGEEWVFPDTKLCLRLAVWPQEGEPILLCGESLVPSAYTGLMVTANFVCNESGSISMLHGRPGSVLHGGAGFYREGDGTTETLTIICGEPPTATPTPTPVPLMGDVDCNGWVDSMDSLLILQFHAALIDSLRCPEGADVNGDGRINSIDAALVIQHNAWDPIELPPPALTPTPTPCPDESYPTATRTATVPVGSPVGLLGDVDCDDSITSTDALPVLQYSGALTAAVPCLENADVNGDARVDSMDALWILLIEQPRLFASGDARPREWVH